MKLAVAQASRLRVYGASPPRGASNGETPSELAAGTATLPRQNENHCYQKKRSFFAAFANSFRAAFTEALCDTSAIGTSHHDS